MKKEKESKNGDTKGTKKERAKHLLPKETRKEEGV